MAMADMPHTDGFRVDGWVDALGGFISRRRRLWLRIANLETSLLADELAGIRIGQPIYISGLARSGSTILLELLSQHQAVATHRYRDFPPVFTPVLWNRLLDRLPRRQAGPIERTHRDGIMVTPDSPEALEEVLWMAFFPYLHDTRTSAVLDGDTSNPGFEAFYRDHIRKLLLVRGGSRYLSKGNYNVTRLDYLLRLFPDARFVIPVREPAGHIASLMKQHALFCEGERRSPRALRHMQRVGHFEFGLDRRPINTGDPASAAEIARLWEAGREAGREVEGWARSWSQVYGHAADRLDTHPALRAASLIVRFEALCRAPRDMLRAIHEHCRLPATDGAIDRLAERLRYPTYYRPQFTPEELEIIHRQTAATAARFGYGPPERGSPDPAAGGATI